MDATDLQDLQAFAGALADAAAQVTLRHFRGSFAVEDKGQGRAYDPVTAADRGAEQAMRALIAQRHPTHGIAGEEQGLERAQAPWRWVLDPIDGTRSFVAGIPLWGTLIALCHEGVPVLGCADHPALGERFLAAGGRAMMRTQQVAHPLRARACAALRDAVLFTTDPDLFDAQDAACLARVRQGARFTRYSADCYAYGLLAAGQLDLVVDAGLEFHDVAALVPIVQAAGGVITDWDGQPRYDGGRILAAGDARVHAQALALLARTA
jgi:myo-inositol-1(or 4)-monophosphatase